MCVCVCVREGEREREREREWECVLVCVCVSVCVCVLERERERGMLGMRKALKSCCKKNCGCCLYCAECCWQYIVPPKIVALNICDNPYDPNYGAGFAEGIFLPGEFKFLKAYCNKQKIKQTDLNNLFQIYLTNDEVYLREFRVNTFDTLKRFERANQSLLSFEIADIFIPALFAKPHEVLPTPEGFDEVTFTRFIVIGYIFCAQPVCDLFYDFYRCF